MARANPELVTQNAGIRARSVYFSMTWNFHPIGIAAMTKIGQMKE
jgi:hypothetical protein